MNSRDTFHLKFLVSGYDKNKLSHNARIVGVPSIGTVIPPYRPAVWRIRLGKTLILASMFGGVLFELIFHYGTFAAVLVTLSLVLSGIYLVVSANRRLAVNF